MSRTVRRWLSQSALTVALGLVFSTAQAPLAPPPPPPDPIELAAQAFEERQTRCLALIGFTEARGEGELGMALVMQTALNRVDAPGYPNTECRVAHQPHQFDGIKRWPADRDPADLDAESWGLALELADALRQGNYPVPESCATATHFYNPSAANPGWARHRTAQPLCTHGGHRFLALRA